jgi:hypothetical protein
MDASIASVQHARTSGITRTRRCPGLSLSGAARAECNEERRRQPEANESDSEQAQTPLPRAPLRLCHQSVKTEREVSGMRTHNTIIDSITLNRQAGVIPEHWPS